MSSIRHLVGKLRGRTVAELRERAGQALAALTERAGWRDAGEPTEAMLRRRLRADLARAGVDRVATLLREHPRPAFFGGTQDLTSTASLIRRRWPVRLNELLRTADDIVGGRFALLGYPVIEIADPVDWHFDPVALVRAPTRHWSTIAYLDPRVAGDHKLVWELNRHQFLVTLGQAFALTGDERYARRAASLLASWMDANPPKRGVNWASSLEVAYRAISWIWAHRLLRRAPAFTAPLQLRWLSYLEVSARHLERYLSTYFSPNTHLTGEALGLLYIGTQLPELRDAERWKRHGWRILQEQVDVQVREDGSYFEQAIHYHRYTLDIYLHARILGAGHGLADVARVDRAIARLAEFLAWTARPDGTIPLFGDEDGGQLLLLDGREPDDVRAPLAVAASLLARPDLRAAGGAPTDDLAWILGADAVRAYDALPATPPEEGARAFSDGGFFVVRDGWGSRSAVLTIDCGPLGVANGGHAHADTLAFDLSVNGAPVFVDAGTVSYTVSSDERHAMRSSLAHNTVSIDGTSSSRPAGPFQWETMTSGQLDAWHATAAGAYFEGHHDGYADLAGGVRHRRIVIAARNAWWIVRDVVEGTAPHDAVATFQCAPGLDARSIGEMLRVTDDGRDVASVQAVGGGGVWQLDRAIASRRYGSREEGRRARYAWRTTSGSSAATFAITRGVGEEWTCEFDGGVGAGLLRLRSEHVEDVVCFDPVGTLEGIRTDARVVWLRRRIADGVVESVMAIGGTTVELDGTPVARPDGGVVSAVRERGEWRVAPPTGARHGAYRRKP